MLRPILTGLIAEVARWYIRAWHRATTAAAMSVIPRHTMSTGITSRHLRSFEGRGRRLAPRRYESGQEVLIHSFQPAKGEPSELSTIDGRTMAMGRSRPCR